MWLSQDPTEYNGVESYVSGMMAEHNLAWLPARNTIAAQDKGMATEDGTTRLTKAFEGSLSELAREMRAVGARLEQVEAAVGLL